ncbi:MAG: phage minor capsid protein [Clostridia bacterium]|nr:phage minor capsid protein [Clostridia bacterium]
MLTPEVLEYILNSLEVHKRLQESVLRDIVRRIVKNGILPSDNLTEGAVYQIEMAQRAGILYDDIVRIVAEESDSVYYDIKNAFDAAEVEILNFDDEVLLDNGYEPEVVKNLSPGMRQIWEAAFEKTFTDAKNLTKTIALTSQSAFISACDLAHMQVASGSFTYQQAIANAVMQAASGGVKVLYPSGASASLDYAVRRAVLTSVNQTAGTIMDMKANEISHDLMETTAHYGARPEHAVWQGQVVSRSGQSGYLSLSDVGYGEVTGIFGANCRHNWFMYFGYRTYTDAQLEDMKNKTVTYGGKEMSVYDATQKQRGMERAVKKTKRELVGLDEAMKNLPAEQQMDLKVDFMNKSGFLKEQEAKLSNFCSQTGLKRDRFREQVFSTETENGIKRWTRSSSMKSVQAAQKHHEKWLKSIGAENMPKSLDKYYKLQYNNPPAFARFEKYLLLLDKKEMSPLITFEQFEKVALSVEKELFGIVTPNGVEVKGYTAHAIGRILGHSALDKDYNRSGVTISEMRGCLNKGAIGKFQTDKDGRPSQAYHGKGITVTVNPDTGEIVQVNRFGGK